MEHIPMRRGFVSTRTGGFSNSFRLFVFIVSVSCQTGRKFGNILDMYNFFLPSAKFFFEVPEKNYYLRRKNAMSKKIAAKSEHLLPSLLKIHVPSNYPDYFDLYEVREQMQRVN
jgi:hypothetical protein